ncbi:MAG TPA: ComEC/Rec2 family competence protein, partial [Ktedonobacterales bacterium]|nr:ComEC/Rec2 family competence protein [Ktedonobacterales bacterium]
DQASAAATIARLPPGALVDARGDVSAEPLPERRGRLLVVAVVAVRAQGPFAWRPATGRVEAVIATPDDWFAPVYGDTVVLSGKLRAVGGGAPPGVVADLAAARARVVARGGGSPLLAALYALRVRLARAMQHGLPEPEAALLIGVLLGLKTPTLRVRLPLFVATGTVHLIVPAGLKVSVFAELARRGLRRFGRWVGSAAALLAVVGYGALGGGGPAALRAAIMGALLALAPLLGRRYDVYTALATAVLVMTALEPLLVRDAGFQLTTLATLGIPLLAPALQAALLRVMALARLPEWLAGAAELLAVTTAAQLATLPVVAVNFGVISLIAPLANLLMLALLVPLLLLAASVAAVTLLLPLLTPVAAFLAWPLAWLTNQAIDRLAALPFAAVTVARVPGWLPIAYYGALVALVGGALLWARRAGMARSWFTGRRGLSQRAAPHWAGRVVLAGTLLCVSLGTTAATFASTGGARLDFLAVGAGPATLLRLADGTTAVIDGGPDGPALEAALAQRLPYWQRTLDLVVVRGPRPESLTGLADLADHYTLGRAVDAGMLHPAQPYIAWVDALRQSRAAHALVRQGSALRLGGATSLTVLAPPQTLAAAQDGATARGNDLILRLVTPGLTVLLLGEADPYELDALAFSGAQLGADVVEVALPAGVALDRVGPLHDVLLAARPGLIVVSQAAAQTGFATASAPAASGAGADTAVAAELGARVIRTSTTGTVSLLRRADGGWSLAAG